MKTTIISRQTKVPDELKPVIETKLAKYDKFFGDDAFVQFKKLAKLFKETTPGNLEHPIWGIRYCYLTGLEMTQEPKDNYVSYRFTFTGAQTNGVVPR